MERFKRPNNDIEIAKIAKKAVPANTTKNTTWAVRVLEEWMASRNKASCDNKCPEDLLDNPDVEKINYWLSTEVRKADGSEYPPRSINLILAGLQRQMLENNPQAPRFMDKNNTIYRDLHRVRDSIYKQLHSAGVGVVVKHASIITPEEEDKLWDSGVLNAIEPLGLQRAVFFYIGKVFCIRGGCEQRALGPSNFRFDDNQECVTYVEHGSKNRAGGIDTLRLRDTVARAATVCYTKVNSL